MNVMVSIHVYVYNLDVFVYILAAMPFSTTNTVLKGIKHSALIDKALLSFIFSNIACLCFTYFVIKEGGRCCRDI